MGETNAGRGSRAKKALNALMRGLFAVVSIARRPAVLAFGCGVAVVLLVLFVVRPFNQPELEDVATTWNESISRLGIEPVYPPDEGIYVGDVWAVVAGSGKDPVLGSSIRIGHVDLRAAASQDDACRRVTFPTEIAAKLADMPVCGKAGDSSVIPTLAAFPGVTIARGRRASAAGGSTLFGISASNEASSTAQISIPEAYTYGVPPAVAASALADFCAHEKTVIWCDDGQLRHLMVHMGLIKAMARAKSGGGYLYAMQIRLVSRVYMTKSISERDEQSTEGGVSADLGPPKPAEAAPAAPAATAESQAATGEAKGADAAPPPSVSQRAPLLKPD